MQKDPSTNVLGSDLAPCSNDPLTGFFRDGACNTCDEDRTSMHRQNPKSGEGHRCDPLR